MHLTADGYCFYISARGQTANHLWPHKGTERQSAAHFLVFFRLRMRFISLKRDWIPQQQCGTFACIIQYLSVC